MGSRKVSVDQMADAIMEGLEEYADYAAGEMKKSVRKVAKNVKEDIKAGAPVGLTGKYKESWAVKTQAETSQSLNLVVHSKNRYQLAHLLEKGHALRNGGRARAYPHIAPAEEKGSEQLVDEIKNALEKGG